MSLSSARRNCTEPVQLRTKVRVCAGIPGRSTIGGHNPYQLVRSAGLFAKGLSTPTTTRPALGVKDAMRHTSLLAAVSIVFLVVLAGCGSSNAFGPGSSSNGSFSISPGTTTTSTNTSVQFTATSSNGTPLVVSWSVSGGDNGNPGSITPSGLYFPPSAIFHNVAIVAVTASQKQSNGSVLTATAKVTVTPGFIAPITPENLAATPGSALQLVAVLGEVGGGAVTWSLSNNAAGGGTPLGAGFGTFSGGTCKTGSSFFTFCTVTYTAPSTLPPGAPIAFATATVTNTTNKQSAQVLLNSSINSNPLSHQALQTAAAVQLGSSGGNAFDADLDQFGNPIDCCGGTLGALLAGSNGQQYVLSTNHVLASSDQGSLGDAIIQPGLPDDANCDPTQANVLAFLSYAAPLNSTTTNSDSAVGIVNATANKTVQVDPTGNILELGTVGSNGQLGAAPPAAGPGEAVTPGNIPAHVVKSGRSTGLTCSTISSIATTVQLQYFFDCAETQPYTNKTFQNQILISGASFTENPGGPAGVFSDITGDSGALVLDQSNAQPIGLLYASNTTSAVANPVGDVLHDLTQAALSQGGTAINFSFVGGAAHPIACLNYDSGTASTPTALSDTEATKSEIAARTALSLTNPQAGILAVAQGSSLDAPGRAGVMVYTDGSRQGITVPQEIGEVRTVVIPVDAASFSLSSAPRSRSVIPGIHLNEATLTSAIATKQKIEQQWLADPAVFAVGVGESYDNPSEAAVIVMVERGKTPASMPDVVDGLRVRYQFADRFHTSHLKDFPKPTSLSGCKAMKSAATGPIVTGWQMPAPRLRLP